MSHLVKHLLELASHMNLHSALQWRMIKNLLPHWGVLILLLHWGGAQVGDGQDQEEIARPDLGTLDTPIPDLRSMRPQRQKTESRKAKESREYLESQGLPSKAFIAFTAAVLSHSASHNVLKPTYMDFTNLRYDGKDITTFCQLYQVKLQRCRQLSITQDDDLMVYPFIQEITPYYVQRTWQPEAMPMGSVGQSAHSGGLR